MAVIKRADAETHLHRAMTLDLGDLEARGRLLRESAASEAERIIKEAHAERERLLEGAREEGKAQGHAEGFKAGKAEGREAGRTEAVAEFRTRLGDSDKAWSDAMTWFIDQRETLLVEARTAVVELAVAIARRVVHRTVELDTTVVLDQLESLLGLITAPAMLILKVNPEDEALVREVLPRLRERFVGGIHVRLQTDADVARGSCVARSLGGASIDANVETQLDRIVREMLPERGAPAPDSSESDPDVPVAGPHSGPHAGPGPEPGAGDDSPPAPTTSEADDQ